MKCKTKHPLATKYLDNAQVWKRIWIVTGGQTGVDRAAFDVALELNLPTRGWVPLDRDSEDGKINEKYPTQETETKDPALRTELNAYDSDATLVISCGIPKDGTGLTEEVARLYDKPIFTIDIDQEVTSDHIDQFRNWIESKNIRILNIAGPRESHRPNEIYPKSYKIIRQLLINS